jgi:hypothetical protein
MGVHILSSSMKDFKSWREILFLYFLFVFFLFFTIELGWLIPDGIGYAAYLPSLFQDGDLHFYNQYVITGMIHGSETHGASVTSTDYITNPWCIGASLLWMIVWLAGHLLNHVSHLWGQHWPSHGFSVYYNFGIRYATALFGLGSILLIYYWTKLHTNTRSALACSLLVAFGTPFYWYALVHADMAHVPAAFLITLFLMVWDSDRTGSDYRNGFLVGLLGGWITITKLNDSLIFLFPLVTCIKYFDRKKTSAIVAGALITGSLQIWVWQIIYGHPFGPIQDTAITHHYGFWFGFFTGRFRLIDVLFSSYHGLFFFAPLLLLSFIGLILGIRKDRLLATLSLLILVFQLILMATERYFWEGVAFGLRRLVDWTPVFAFGLALILERFRKPVLIIAICAASWTILLTNTYRHLPASTLYDFQPPGLILKWIQSYLSQLPQKALALLTPSISPGIFIPGILVFSIAGLPLLKLISGLCKKEESRQASLILTAVVVLNFFTGYFLVARAFGNQEAARERYANATSVLSQNQNSVLAAIEVQSLLREGEYLGLTRGWETAKTSFQEALQVSGDRQFTLEQIRKIIQKHMSPAEVDLYLNSLNT